MIRLWLSILVVLGVLLPVIANPGSAMSITDHPMVAADLNLDIDLGIGRLANSVAGFFPDALDLSNQPEPMVKQDKEDEDKDKDKDKKRKMYVPEPVTWLLIGGSLGGLVLYMKMRKK